jgi:hypothetical protein
MIFVAYYISFLARINKRTLLRTGKESKNNGLSVAVPKN